MRRPTPIVWIAFGLVSVTMSLMLLGNVLVKVAPDQSEEAYWFRKSLAETLAVQYSKLAEHNALDAMQAAMRALVERNEEIRSVALRRSNGPILAQAGEHDRHWVQPPGDESTFDHVQVPIMNGDSRWGTLELAFRPSSESGLWWFLNPWFQFLALVGVLGYLAYLAFMKKTLRQLDPSAVVPDRVRTALDVLPVGVVLADSLDQIVLANRTFAQRVGVEPNALIGHDLCDFPWVELGDKDSPQEFPWTVARKLKRPAAATHLALNDGNGDCLRFIVTSSPVLDDRGVLRGVLASFHDVTELDRANSQLREAITELESSRTQVLHQNQELENANDTLQIEINERKKAQAEREELHRQLMAASRRAGMADVASSVLHNVGNVLNSINISTDTVLKTLRKPMMGDVCRIASMFHEHQDNLHDFLTQDPKGVQIPAYLTMVAESLSGSHKAVQDELDALVKSVDHIRQIIMAQQDIARVGNIREAASAQDLMEQALSMALPEPEKYQIQVVREYAQVPMVMTDRHQVMQILVNLIANSKNAMVESPGKLHRLTLRVGLAADQEGFMRLQVTDTGSGIKPEHLPRLFSQGFTTRKAGHGLGLHSSAIAAKNLKGTLQAHSAGEGQGATFTLDLPLTLAEVTA